MKRTLCDLGGSITKSNSSILKQKVSYNYFIKYASAWLVANSNLYTHMCTCAHTHTHTHPSAAAAAKSLQSCPTLCDPTDGSPQGSPIPGILQARTLEWVAISFSYAWKWKAKVKSLSRARLLATPWTAAYQAPPSMGFSRQEYWRHTPLKRAKSNGQAGRRAVKESCCLNKHWNVNRFQ